MLDAHDEKLIAAREYLAEAFPGYSVGEFAGEAEFLIGVTTRSFRVERDDVSTVITLTHQFFRDTKITSVIDRLQALAVAETARSHPGLQVFVWRDRVRLAEPGPRQRRHTAPALVAAPRCATDRAFAGTDPPPGEDLAALIDQLRREVQQAQAEFKALGDRAMMRSNEALAEIAKLERAYRQGPNPNEAAPSQAVSERQEMRLALRQCQEIFRALREQLQHDGRQLMAEARALAEQTMSPLDEMVERFEATAGTSRRAART